MTNLKQIDNLKLAVAVVLLGGFLIAFGDAMVKFVGGEVPLWQTMLLRSLLVVAALIPLIHFAADKSGFVPRSIFWVALRSFVMTMFIWCFYIALGRVQLALGSALVYTFPLFVVLLMPLFGCGRAQGKTWALVGLAFLGMLVIVRPTPSHFNAFALLALAAGIFYALGMLITRTKLMDENPKVAALWQSVAFTLASLICGVVVYFWQPEFADNYPFYFSGWVALSAIQWAIMGILASAYLIASIAVVFAYQHAPAAVVSTFDYCYLLCSLFWGWLLLAEIPTSLDTIGIAMIATAGILIVRNPKLTTTN